MVGAPGLGAMIRRDVSARREIAQNRRSHFSCCWLRAFSSSETALAHVIGDKAEQAYRRSDALEKRRKLMDAWAAYCEPKTSANVVQLRKQNSSRP